eukprot:2921941-Prymnesium_polylepis.1
MADQQWRSLLCLAAGLMSGATRTAMIKSTTDHDTKVNGAHVCAPLRRMSGAQLCAVRAPKLRLVFAEADRLYSEPNAVLVLSSHAFEPNVTEAQM